MIERIIITYKFYECIICTKMQSLIHEYAECILLKQSNMNKQSNIYKIYSNILYRISCLTVLEYGHTIIYIGFISG